MQTLPHVSLRPYQVESIDRIRSAIRDGKRRVLLVVPTGGGKTLTAASMLAGALSRGKRSVFAAHRKELIDQTVRTFASLGITSVGVIRAKDARADSKQPIQIASIQTLARRKKPEGIAVVFIDEAHRSMADSYRKHLFESFPNAIFVGLTATPVRADGKPLGRSKPEDTAGFDELIIGARYSELIAGGFIEEPLVYSTPVLPDLSRVKTSGGDYNAEELAEAVNKSVIVGDIVRNWQKHAQGRRTVVFAVTCEHSRALCQAFVDAGVVSEHLDGETPEPEREAILERLRVGKTQVVCNVGVLCEGWDMPECKCLVLARPTKSLALYMQMAGRILRPYVDVERVRPLILDHGCCVDRHGFPHEDREWSLTAKPKRGGPTPTRMCPECFAMIAAGCKECPHCAAALQQLAIPREQEVLDHVELALRTLEGEDAQLAFYRKHVAFAKERGLRPGWVYHLFLAKFKKEPPREWGKALKRAAKKDVVWSEGIARRAADREVHEIREALALSVRS